MADQDSYGKISNAAVLNATGRSWDEWFKVLDDAGAVKMSHPEIARWLGEAHVESGWWCQSITVAYEQARGLRKPHEQSSGVSVSVSKTMSVSPLVAYEGWIKSDRRSAWLPDGPELEFTTANKDKNLRAIWPIDESRLIVSFNQRSNSRCQVVVQCERLPDLDTVEARRAYWKAALGRLEAYCAKK